MQVIYPGSFDPPTKGHEDIILRASQLFDKIYILISVNPQKLDCLLTQKERQEILEAIFASLKNVEVCIWSGLVVDFAHHKQVYTILRSLRPLSDFNFEFELADINKRLCPPIETLFLNTHTEYFSLRSSLIKELLLFHQDVKPYLPLASWNFLQKKGLIQKKY